MVSIVSISASKYNCIVGNSNEVTIIVAKIGKTAYYRTATKISTGCVAYRTQGNSPQRVSLHITVTKYV